MNVAVHEIKTRFSEYLRRMQAGEEIVVTARGKPVARLVPAGSGPCDSETGLRGYDSVHLAAAESVQEAVGSRADFRFLGFDDRQTKAALALGLQVVAD